MQKTNLVIFLFFVGISSTVNLTKIAIPVVLQTITLTALQTEGPGNHFNVDLMIDGVSKSVLFDTGSPSSRIPFDNSTKNYEILSKKESIGVSGKGTTYDLVKPKKISFGGRKFLNYTISRGGGGILGLDLLSKVIFKINLNINQVEILNQLPAQAKQFKIKVLDKGHMTIPIKLGNKETYVLFDTGSNATIIDLQFLNKNRELFTHIRSEVGSDHNSNEVPSEIYYCKDIKIAHLQLKNVEMATFNFPDFLRKAMEGTPIILGTNIIKEAKWTFDLKNRIWLAE